MRRWSGQARAGGLLVAALVGAGCAAVDVPEEHFYRLDPPTLRPVPVRSVHVLRVEGLELDSGLSSDRLLVADSPVQLRAYEFHRWLNPLQRLVQDALLRGLRQSRAFAEVHGPAGPGGASLQLSGRILDCHQVADADAWAARVTLALRLERAADRQVLVAEEFTATVPLVVATPAAAVTALSHGLRDVLAEFLARCGAAGVFSGVAGPGR